MANVNVRRDTGKLVFDFYFRGVRCREQTALDDTTVNRRKAEAFMARISREIAQGSFDYATTFPNSSRAALFNREGIGAAVSAVDATSASEAAHPTPTFADFSITWRAEMAPQWRRLHREGVDAIFDAHLLPVFGERPVGEISKADVLGLRATLTSKPGRGGHGLTAARINKIVGILRQCLTEAADRYTLSDAFKGVRRLKARRPDVHPFTLEEVEKIRTTIRADFRNYVTVRFFTGMRTGEINGLKWKYVDFDKGLILVRETFSAGMVEEDAKTERSLREIPMLPQVKEALLAQREHRHPTSDYVFANRDGQPLDAHNFTNRVWYPLLRYLGLERRRPYQTRHTTATLMLASGENPEWIARLMGHANTQMLFTVYSRFVPNLTHRDGLAIAGLLSRHAETAKPPAATTDIDLNAMTAAQLREALKQLLVSPPAKEGGPAM